jgi:acyl-CoA thioester hydrolase
VSNRGIFFDEGVKKRMKNWSACDVRVRYAETDAMGVVYHGSYLPWLELGRVELVRQIGFSYKDIEQKGFLLPVLEVSIKYRSPARFDDALTVFTRINEISKVKLNFEYRIVRNDSGRGTQGLSDDDKNALLHECEVLVEAATYHTWLNRDWKPARLDRGWPELFDALAKLDS